MTATFWKNYSKRINSTKKPTTSGTDHTIKLKDSTSVENPVFLLDTVDLYYNYCKWNNHYYYIQDIILSTNKVYEVHCVQDLLATHKNEILDMTAFVEYSSSNYNTDILDPRISNTGNVVRTSTYNNFVSGFFNLTGNFIVSIASPTGSAVRYIMSASDIATMMSYINTVSDDNVLDAVVKKYGSLQSCILGCTWVPYSVENNGTDYPVQIGPYTITGLTCKKCNASMKAHGDNTSVAIPWNNTTLARRHRETIQIYLPGYGTTTLDASRLVGLSSLTLTISADITGGVIYTLRSGDDVVNYYSCNLGASIPITTLIQSPIGAFMQTTSQGAAYVSDMNALNNQPFSSAVNSFISNITGRLTSFGMQSSSIGGQGGIVAGKVAQVFDIVRLTSYDYTYAEAQENMATMYGRPLMAVTPLLNLTGYCKCNGASIDCDGLADDKDAINSFLNGGFYIE